MFQKLRFMLLISFVLMMQGCALWPARPAPPEPLQASLRQLCLPVPDPENGQRLTLLNWGVEIKTAYAVCASRLQRVLEARP